jgi:hypothetical protein
LPVSLLAEQLCFSLLTPLKCSATIWDSWETSVRIWDIWIILNYSGISNPLSFALLQVTIRVATFARLPYNNCDFTAAPKKGLNNDNLVNQAEKHPGIYHLVFP